MAADETRQATVGDGVHLRGVVEISNRCVRNCKYCGINATNTKVPRYEMTREDILQTAQGIATSGCQTIVLQSGEHSGLDAYGMAELILEIKALTNLDITLSLGLKSEALLELWKRSGADRYLLKFETSSADLFEETHTGKRFLWEQRIQMLEVLKDLGYETGSGVIIGLPGQTMSDLVNDMLLMDRLNLDMIAIGPYQEITTFRMDPSSGQDQVPNSELQTQICIAIMRLMNPGAHIPATAALAANMDEDGRWRSLTRGCNVVMPNFTPVHYREKYALYPSELRSVAESGPQLVASIVRQLTQLCRPAVLTPVR